MKTTIILEDRTDKTLHQRLLHGGFMLGIWLKGVDAIFEIIGGIAFLLVSNITLNKIVTALTLHELVEDPRDRVALFLRQSAAQVTVNTRFFGGTYLVLHGLTKLWLVSGLLRKKSWAYPATLGFLFLFIAYEVYRLSYSFSFGLALLTVFDSVFWLLICREYRLARQHRTISSDEA
ncbi:MAG: DUF2127 domain-containing protein [Bacteroidota bacterium]